MDWTRQIDLYCERVGESWWAEPANALTSLAFFAAAWLAWRQADALAARGLPVPREFRVLAVLVAGIGAGSLAFHTLATVWAGRIDTLFIAAFFYVFIASYLLRAFALGPGAILAALAAYWLAGQAFGRWVEATLGGAFLSGSYEYLPALAVLVALALASSRRSRRAAAALAVAAGVFALSLGFRTLDDSVCALLPLGTHFIWHLLHGASLWLAMRALHAAHEARLARS